MKIIAIVETEDCGPFAVIDSDAISLIRCYDFYLAATHCAFTGRVLTCQIDEECANHLVKNGVRCVDWEADSTSKDQGLFKKKSE